MKVAHLTTADISLWYLLLPQLREVLRYGGIALGISAPGKHGTDLQSAGIEHVALHHSTRSNNPVADLRVFGEFRRALKHVHPDVLHTHTPKPGIYGRIMGRMGGVPVVLNTVHGLYASPDDPFVKKAIVYSLEAVASRFSDYELIQSVEDYRLLTRFRITRPNRTILLGNGIDLARFNPGRFSQDDRTEIRSELGIAEGQFATGIVARLVREKGYVELIAAAEQLSGRHVILAIGPDDPAKQGALSLEERTRAERAGIRFLGHRDDVERLYAAMDAFVLPSHREGFPRAAMEAAAMGLPVAASDIRGCRQVVDDGTTGVLFPRGDADSIARALQQLADDPELCRRLGCAARTKSLGEFDERSVVRTVLRTQVIALREKGHFERLETETEERFSIRWASRRDLAVLAAIAETANGRVGASRLVRALSRRLRASKLKPRIPDTAVLNDGFGPVGFAESPHVGRRRTCEVTVPLRPIRRALGKWSQLTAPPWRNRSRAAPEGIHRNRVHVARPFQGIGLEEALTAWIQRNQSDHVS